MADPAVLLERHRPLLRYDTQDPYRACSALTIVENPGNQLLDRRGGLPAAVGDVARALGLASLQSGDDCKGQPREAQAVVPAELPSS